MYDSILEGLYSSNGLFTEDEKCNYLEGLKPAAEALSRSYRNERVNVAYDARRTQAAYILRYFPQHVEIIRHVLSEVSGLVSLPFDQGPLYTRHFGCGPAPEVCGLLQFLQSRFPACRGVSAHLYDAASNDWAYSRRITLEHVVPHLQDKLWVETRAAQFNFTAVDLTATIRGMQSIQKAHLVTFQNCLNEIPAAKRNAVVENAVALTYGHGTGWNSALGRSAWLRACIKDVERHLYAYRGATSRLRHSLTRALSRA